ncbi:TetR/AcrR family transcriptional regulator [Natronosporangium hydrolyticum]|uniref:TetR/AcrR family transcriptional regulator n=1 Tax=Natronosporangium hydrolyticum TaxID=2811111 RepID=A0A895YCW7_9ACTN|nr:TetR/AcrR family transcriptional regulator [Natronosporangium hydrolyticum]QSB13293.1 TetR/AcrR family transcriptional regulator [Natronosporangium hydrolyticum]
MDREMGLRERKRLAAMRRIQEVALELFDLYGYQQVPIERIADAAEVSPSSVYRYFGTKEQIVLWDEYDPIAIERIASELLSQPPIEAVRRVMDETIGEMMRVDEQRVRRRIHHMMQEPAIAAATAVQAHEVATMIIGRFAEQLGRDPNDLELHVFAHGFVGAIIGVMRYWYTIDFRQPLPALVDQVITSFERGFSFP